MSDPATSRSVAARLVVTGAVRLVTPTQLGNGDAESITDMPLLRDALTGRPLLTGTSIAGALRGYLLAREHGYARPEQISKETPQLVAQLFGSVKGDDTGEQSALVVGDALGALPTAPVEIRDGVKIDYQTRTADDRKKYDLELLPAGTRFDLTFELLLPEDVECATALREALALALQGFMSDGDSGSGAITLGARRSRGFGRCVADMWQMQLYNLQTHEGLLAWIAADHAAWGPAPTAVWSGTAAEVQGPHALPSERPDGRASFRIAAAFAIDSSILIRSTDPLTPIESMADTNDQSLAKTQPDVAHLRSHRDGNDALQPILPGTSLAGALRARATRILNTLGRGSDTKRQDLIDALFGREMQQNRSGNMRITPSKSRLIVEEALITDGQALVQSRVALDRFTGGPLDTALFSEAPHFGGGVQLRLTLQHDAADAGLQQGIEQQSQIGLLLLLLKDLWTSDLPLGGSSSIGRGRLRGQRATLTAADGCAWTIAADEADAAQRQTRIDISGTTPKQLQDYVDALLHHLEA